MQTQTQSKELLAHSGWKNAETEAICLILSNTSGFYFAIQATRNSSDLDTRYWIRQAKAQAKSSINLSRVSTKEVETHVYGIWCDANTEFAYPCAGTIVKAFHPFMFGVVREGVVIEYAGHGQALIDFAPLHSKGKSKFWLPESHIVASKNFPTDTWQYLCFVDGSFRKSEDN